MPASDLLQNEIESTQGQASIRSANGDTCCGEKERHLFLGAIPRSLSFEVIGQSLASISRDKDRSLRFSFAFHASNFRLTRAAKSFGCVRFDLVQIQANHLFAPQTSGE